MTQKDRTKSVALLVLLLLFSLDVLESNSLKIQILLAMFIFIFGFYFDQNTPLFLVSPIQLVLLNNFELDKNDFAMIGVVNGFILLLFFVLKLDVFIFKLISNSFTKIFLFFNMFVFVGHLMSKQLSTFILYKSSPVMLLLSIVLTILFRKRFNYRISNAVVFLQILLSLIVLRGFLTEDFNVASFGKLAYRCFTEIKEVKPGKRIQDFIPTPFIFEMNMNFNIKKVLSFSLFTIIEAVICLKNLKLNYQKRRKNFFYLGVLSFILGLFGFFGLGLNSRLNLFLNQSIKKKQKRILIVLLSFCLILFMPSWLVSIIKSDLIIYSVSIVFLTLLVLNHEKFEDFLKSSIRNMILFIIAFSSFLYFNNTAIALAIVYLLDILVYMFKTKEMGSSELIFENDEGSERYFLNNLYDDFVIYRIKGSFNFMKTNEHLRRVRKLPFKVILVDLEDVMQNGDIEYSDSYTDMIDDMSRLKQKTVVFKGIPNRECEREKSI